MHSEKELLDTHCPVAVTQTVIGGKWKLVIVWQLRNGAKRFSELQKALPDIRQGYLTQQLRELESDGLVHREVYKEVPPKVEYSLTDIGSKFLGVLDKMCEWGKEYLDFLNSSNPRA